MTFIQKVQRLVEGLLPDELVRGRAGYKFQFSDKLTKLIIERRIKDLSYYADLTNSEIVERTLMSLLPRSATASRYVNQVLLGRRYAYDLKGKLVEEPYGIREALIDIFRDNADGTDKAHHDNLRPLVVFTREILPRRYATYKRNLGEEGWQGFVVKKWEAMERDIMHSQDGEKDVLKSIRNVSDRKYRDQYAFELEKEYPEILPFNYVVNILDNWDILKSFSSTYEFLFAFIEGLEPWHDADIDRIEFQSICDEVMLPWDEQSDPSDVEGFAIEGIEWDARS